MAKSQTRADRGGLVFLGIVLIALGIAGVLWCLEPEPLPPLVETLEFPWVAQAREAQWFPGAVLALGLLLAIAGLANILGRLGHQRVGDLRLKGSSTQGRLTIDPKAVLKAASEELSETLGVRSVKTTTRVMRGVKVVQLRVDAEPIVSLSHLKRSIERTRANMRMALGDRAEVRVIVNVSEATTAGAAPRVR